MTSATTPIRQKLPFEVRRALQTYYHSPDSLLQKNYKALSVSRIYGRNPPSLKIDWPTLWENLSSSYRFSSQQLAYQHICQAVGIIMGHLAKRLAAPDQIGFRQSWEDAEIQVISVRAVSDEQVDVVVRGNEIVLELPIREARLWYKTEEQLTAGVLYDMFYHQAAGSGGNRLQICRP